MTESFLKVDSINKNFTKASPGIESEVHALSDISFELNRGEILGLIGESGSGKTTLGKCLLRLEQPDGGNIIYKDKNLLQIPEKEFTPFRSKFQMIFQHAAEALNPLHTVEASMTEPLSVIMGLNKNQIANKIKKLMDSVGLEQSILQRYPNQLSGGQKQRVLIARALSVEPELLIADEPTSSQDIALKEQILNLFKKIHDQFKLTLVIISHDISIFKSLSNRIAVLYKGKLVELAETDQILHNPVHPYTRELLLASYLNLDAVELFQPNEEKDVLLGCPFLNRCAAVSDRCSSANPELEQITTNHFVACHSTAELKKQKFKIKIQNQDATL